MSKNMLFQLDLLTTTIIFVMIAVIGTSLILFIAGTIIMQTYANSKTWDSSYKLALEVNLIWLISSLSIGIPISVLAGDTVLIDILRFGVNMVVGVIVVMKLYKKTLGESIAFVLMIQIILYITAILFGYIFNGIIAFVLFS